MKFKWKHAFNWKVAFLRIIINGLALALTALLLPNILIHGDPLYLSFLILSIALGILNALVKPIIQFLTLSLLFTSYGIVIVIINSLILILLAFLLPELFEIRTLLAAFIGGAIIGLASIFLEYLFGLTPPIVDDVVIEEGGN